MASDLIWFDFFWISANFESQIPRELLYHRMTTTDANQIDDISQGLAGTTISSNIASSIKNSVLVCEFQQDCDSDLKVSALLMVPRLFLIR